VLFLEIARAFRGFGTCTGRTAGVAVAQWRFPRQRPRAISLTLGGTGVFAGSQFRFVASTVLRSTDRKISRRVFCGFSAVLRARYIRPHERMLHSGIANNDRSPGIGEVFNHERAAINIDDAGGFAEQARKSGRECRSSRRKLIFRRASHLAIQAFRLRDGGARLSYFFARRQ